MNLYKAINERESTRKYSSLKVEDKILEELELQLQKLTPLNASIKARFIVIRETNTIRKIGLGYSGGKLMINAPYYIIGVVENVPGCLENIGFMLEQAVLKLQDQNISTCWFGSYDQKKLKDICDLSSNEIIAITIAFGYKEKRLFDFISKRLFINTKRKSINDTVFYEEWKKSANEYLDKREELKKILHMSSLYPLANNRQPVRVMLENNRAILFVEKYEERELFKLDAGIFMSHFYLSALNEGFKVEISREKCETVNYNIPEEYEYTGSMWILLKNTYK